LCFGEWTCESASATKRQRKYRATVEQSWHKFKLNLLYTLLNTLFIYILLLLYIYIIYKINFSLSFSLIYSHLSVGYLNDLSRNLKKNLYLWNNFIKSIKFKYIQVYKGNHFSTETVLF